MLAEAGSLLVGIASIQAAGTSSIAGMLDMDVHKATYAVPSEHLAIMEESA